ncbi:MAG: YitT family protein [Lachnospiraceae bacterium]
MFSISKKKSGVLFMDVLFDVIGSLFFDIGIHCFVEPASIAPGGMSGIAIIVNYLTKLPIGVMTFALNIPLLILAYKFLGRGFALKTIKSLFISTAILDYLITPFLPQYTGDRLIGSVFGGILMGVGLAVIFMRGSTTGGTDILSYLVQLKFPHIPIGKAILMIDCIIIAASILVFKNVETGLFGIISLFCCTKAIDNIIYGMEKGIKFTIYSQNNREIAEEIMNQLERGVTLLEGKGAYTMEQREILQCVVRKPEYSRVKSIINKVDDKAFVTISEVDEVLGEGFKPIR